VTVSQQQATDPADRKARSIERLFEQLQQRLQVAGGWNWREKNHAGHRVIEIHVYPELLPRGSQNSVPDGSE
jgi:hypothetical protein